MAGNIAIHPVHHGWEQVTYFGRRRVEDCMKEGTKKWPGFATELQSKRPIERDVRPEDRAHVLRSLPAYCEPPLTSPSSPASDSTVEVSFLQLPPEVRNMIYKLSVRYPSIRELNQAHHAQRTRGDNVNGFSTRLYTPAILLLCKQVTLEAISVLQLRPFIIDRLPTWIMGNSVPQPITDLIGKETLQSIRFAEFRITFGDAWGARSGNIWFGVLSKLLKVWAEKNSLVRLHVMIKIHNATLLNMWAVEFYDYVRVSKAIEEFVFRHGAKPDMLDYEHWMVDGTWAFRGAGKNRQIRTYPDPNIWPGDITQWLSKRRMPSSYLG
ncbi:hypothetical protein F5Y18DRAFT_170391 [Xylariaceae sp. FL1019]|nr:hypothetical protein F5Y18DRAFT_170391 [Xylariaceae sp. FL1019]